ncbi:MAG: hypothetical protein JNJ48_02590 [Phycisphaerae bacterium]|nr:hypothetical protein [Phycisphaerae bacterium]
MNTLPALAGRWLAALVIAGAAALAPAALAGAGGDPPRIDPRQSAESRPGRWQAWSSDLGPKRPDGSRAPLNYLYRMPLDFEPGKRLTPRTVVVFFPDIGGDARSLAALMPGETFRPTDILIALDGVTPSPGEPGRPDPPPIWAGEKVELGIAREVALDLSRQFPTSRICLAGLGQGGCFAAYFGAEWARIIDGGVVAIGSGLWNWTSAKGPASTLPIVLLHARADANRPYWSSLLALGPMQDAGLRGLMLRRLSGDSSFDAAQVSACIDWITAMRTGDADEALAAVRAMLSTSPPPLALARRALARFEPGGGGAPFKALDPQGPAAKAAWALSVAIEAHAQQQAREIGAVLSDGAMLDAPDTPERAAGAARLAAAREDFRGVAAMESLAARLDADRRLALAAAKAEQLLSELGPGARPAEAMARAVDLLPVCLTFDGLAASVAPTLDRWRAGATELGIDSATVSRWESLRPLVEAAEAGRRAHASAVRAWAAPGP